MSAGTAGNCVFGFVCLTEPRFPYIDLALAIASKTQGKLVSDTHAEFSSFSSPSEPHFIFSNFVFV